MVIDPARIDRNSTIGVGEIGVGRSTSVQRVGTGLPVTLRCPIGGIEDPSGFWSFYGPPNANGDVMPVVLTDDYPGVTITYVLYR